MIIAINDYGDRSAACQTRGPGITSPVGRRSPPRRSGKSASMGCSYYRREIASDADHYGQPTGAVIVSHSRVSRLYQCGQSATVCRRPVDLAYESGNAGG